MCVFLGGRKKKGEKKKKQTKKEAKPWLLFIRDIPTRLNSCRFALQGKPAEHILVVNYRKLHSRPV